MPFIAKIAIRFLYESPRAAQAHRTQFVGGRIVLTGPSSRRFYGLHFSPTRAPYAINLKVCLVHCAKCSDCLACTLVIITQTIVNALWSVRNVLLSLWPVGYLRTEIA